MDVLDLFTQQRREVGVTEAASLLGRPKSTVSRWLSAMEDAGFVDREPVSGRYRLGMRLAALGQLARQSTSLQQHAHPHLVALAEATGETANLVLLSGVVAVNVEMVEGPRPIKHVGWLGRQLPLHATAAGKTLLAWLPPDGVDRLVPAHMSRYTALTVTARGRLREELARVREQGYAEAWGEFEDDLVGVGAPVRDHEEEVVAALTISAPMARIVRDSIPRLALEVMRHAEQLSAALGSAGARARVSAGD